MLLQKYLIGKAAKWRFALCLTPHYEDSSFSSIGYKADMWSVLPLVNQLYGEAFEAFDLEKDIGPVSGPQIDTFEVGWEFSIWLMISGSYRKGQLLDE